MISAEHGGKVWAGGLGEGGGGDEGTWGCCTS